MLAAFLLCVALLRCRTGAVAMAAAIRGLPSLQSGLATTLRNTDRLMLYNTLSRRKELFVPRESPKVSFYSCGPTVYDYAHIGNFRAFLTYDLLKRWLSYNGYAVDHVCNLTDIDDKIINKMVAEGKTLKEITDKYSAAFFEDLQVLNIVSARAYPRATEHVDAIEAMVNGLLERNFAYEEGGSVYFRVKAFASYGELANLVFDEMRSGAGGAGPNERRGVEEKESSRDFALWKAEPTDPTAWDSRWGRGRPGWHIECSAMCHQLLGPSIDIHGGGIDLVFPHHSNEIAQSEAFSGQKYSNFWIHNGFVNINNEKMSKSLRNFKTLRDIAAEPFDARAFRYMVVTAQYRSPLNFTPESLKAASTSLRRVDRLLAALRLLKEGSGEGCLALQAQAAESLASFETAMCDDMNTPRAAAALFALLSAAENALKRGDELTSADSRVVLGVIEQIDSVLGVIYEVPAAYFSSSSSGGGGRASAADGSPLPLDEVPAEVLSLVDQRTALKAAKRFTEADALRLRILDQGYSIKDGKDGGAIYRL